MKNRFFTTFMLLLVGVTTAFAQDFIVLKTGSEIKSKIVELTPSEVKYKAFDNLDGPTITIEKSTVFMLRYTNGKTEVVNAITAEKVDNQPVRKVEAAKVDNVEPQPTPSVSNRQELTKTTLDKKGVFTGGIFIGGSLPLGNYADKDLTNDEAAGAKLGFNIGLQVGYRFNKTMSLLLEGQFALNAYEMAVEDVRYIYTLRGHWTHIQLLPSFRAEMPINTGFSLYGMAGAGVSFTSVSDDFADVLEYVDVKNKATGFAYSVSVGCIVAKHVNIGLKYMGSNPAFEDYKPTISNLQAVVGFQF